MIVLLPTEVSDSLLYLKWQFLFQGTLIEALLSLYEKHYFDHHCLHGSHNAEKTMHRSGLCCCSHCLDHVQTLQVDKCLRSSGHPNGLMFPAVSGIKAILVYMWRWRQDLSGLWLLASAVRMEMKVLVWKYNVWAVEDNGSAGRRNDISPVKSRQ